ncbi:hypothetical protein ABEX53_10515 [Bacillus toyonensis]|uniref:HNH endonuclease n=1 Tax=Bacillus toyonensis TaxID=155322 RepID=UPI000BFD87F4|nr:hypothetical protein [Bacillus toyonensis]MED3541308.1 hypothetical protein [Bacillus toyonensis]PHF82269.1 hypothetical protein COI46_26480 [Bacillus toyonensis]
MLLPKKKSAYHDQLEKISNFIIRLLEFSIKYKMYNESKFLTYFREEGTWYLTKSKSIKGPVLSGFLGLFELNIEDRKRLLKVYLNDIQFQKLYKSEDYELESYSLEENLRTTLNNFLVPFYQNIFNNSGFQKIEGLSHSPFSRKEFLKGYKLTNEKSIQVCPICCGKIIWTDNMNHSELDHYFPKSIYPALAIAADNLVPMCNDCNTKAKLGKNPLNNNGKGAIRNAFIPYVHSGIDEITINYLLGEKSKFEVEILPNDPADEFVKLRIKNFDRIYNIRERWASDIELLYESFMNVLTARDVDGNNINNIQALQKEIEIQRNAAKQGEEHIPSAYQNKCFFESTLNNQNMQKAILADYNKRTCSSLNSVQPTMQP